jgi:hypothetical protein
MGRHEPHALPVREESGVARDQQERRRLGLGDEHPVDRIMEEGGQRGALKSSGGLDATLEAAELLRPRTGVERQEPGDPAAGLGKDDFPAVAPRR